MMKDRGYKPYHIVDGQQRITTSIILLQSIIDVVRNLHNSEAINHTSINEIINQYIYKEKCKGSSKSYIFSYEENNPSYHFFLSKIYNDCSISKNEVQTTKYTNNLHIAYNIFYNHLKDMEFEEIQDLYKKITQKFLFNIYEISDDIDVFVTFETMNNRGKVLSNLELLKNRLIYLSTLLPNPKNGEEDDLRKSINDAWKNIYHYLGKNEKNVLEDDEFLIYHSFLYFRNDESIQKAKVNPLEDTFYFPTFLLNQYFVPEKIYSKEMKISQLFNYIHDIKNSVEKWYYINNPDSSNYGIKMKRKLNNIISIMSTYQYRGIRRFYLPYIIHDEQKKYFLNGISSIKSIILYTCCKYEEDVSKRLIKELERYLFFMELYKPTMESFPSAETDREKVNLSYNPNPLLDLLENENGINSALTYVSEINEKFISDSNGNSNMRKYYEKNGFYKTEFPLKYVLAEYEEKLRNESKSGKIRMDEEKLINSNIANTIEHIYPLRARNSYWMEIMNKYTPDQRKSLKNTLGNLVPISNEKNSKLSNLPFPQKKSNSSNQVGYKNGSYSEIELMDYENWGAEEILNRGLKLINFLNERWGITFNKKNDKVVMLGLTFIRSSNKKEP